MTPPGCAGGCESCVAAVAAGACVGTVGGLTESGRVFFLGDNRREIVAAVELGGGPIDVFVAGPASVGEC